MRDRSHDDSMAEFYAEHPDAAAEMLNSLLQDGEPLEWCVLLRRLGKAFGNVEMTPRIAEMNEEEFRETVAAQGDPALSSLRPLLKAMGDASCGRA